MPWGSGSTIFAGKYFTETQALRQAAIIENRLIQLRHEKSIRRLNSIRQTKRDALSNARAKDERSRIETEITQLDVQIQASEDFLADINNFALVNEAYFNALANQEKLLGVSARITKAVQSLKAANARLKAEIRDNKPSVDELKNYVNDVRDLFDYLKILRN